MRPEPAFADKEISKFRDYTVDPTDPLKERVQRTYREMHLNQTVDFVKGWCMCLFTKVLSGHYLLVIFLFQSFTKKRRTLYNTVH